jgi:predicted nucleic acid-binding Zn ribbon protein
MPKFDVFCTDCNKRYEIEKSYSDLTPMACPKGHTERLVRKITKPPVVKYKGDGFTLAKGESDVG